MSSLLALQTKDTIIFSSDTALSVNYNKKSFRVGSDETKIFEYENFIMFASGKKYIRDLFISYTSYNSNIHDIISILEGEIKDLCRNDFGLEIVIAMRDTSKIIFLTSLDGFKYSENICNDENTHVFTAGYKTNEIANKFTTYFDSNPLKTSLVKTYKDISCDEIGGKLNVYIINSGNVQKSDFIIDRKKIYTDKEINAHLHNLVHAERLVGKLILGNKLHIEDELGVVVIENGAVKVYDLADKLRVQLGRYPNPNNPSQWKYGLNIADGSFDIRTSENNNRGVQFDGNGIRTFNNNAVRTFNIDAATGMVEIIGSLNIKTSTDTNKGVTIDGDGIKGFNASGQIKFQIDNNGNAWFGGKLESATGTLDNVGGTVDNLGGTFAGTLNGVDGVFTGSLSAATGDFGGIVTGTLSAQTMSSITINADQINALRITADMIDVTSLSAISADIGTINTGTLNGIMINTEQDITVGNNIYIGDRTDNSAKSIIFNSRARIESTSTTMSIGAPTVIMESDRCNFQGIVDFSGATVIGLP